MRRLILVAGAALALAACDKNDTEFVHEDNVVVNDVKNDVDECPRADGTPCR